MKKYFNKLRADKLLLRLYAVAFLLLVLTFIIIVIVFTKLPPLLPVFNQLPWGEDRLSPKLGIFIPLLISLIYIFINVFLSVTSYEKYPIIARIFAITSSLIALLTLLFVARTITLII